MHGIICIWSGRKADVPDGWVVCDGENGTPDLRNKFVRCPGSYYAVYQTGGGRYHNHSGFALTESHAHAGSAELATDKLDVGPLIPQNYPDGPLSSYTEGHVHTLDIDDTAHEHLLLISTADHNPSFMCLWYIMKL